ncbi:glutamate-cysteine ligase family protein [Nocardioides sp. CER19]|uniref:carboxylate-amine ligase n=1 Tax=Nocardioides sp. CER19 TaxID=3038538 RepID=UPI00244D39C5|nr:glutamate-cysteine ligase family protein [Nocardioides sp. CER19]MDH2413920.1 glutamate-cysteine ligase family protein [Nocardioides sp. CER19]
MGHLVPVTVPPFRSGGEFTLGAEDELLLTRADGAPSGVGAESTIAKLRQRPGLQCSVSPEEYADEIEFGTPICDDAASMIDALAGARAALQEVRQGAMAVGVHPAAGLGDFTVSAGARYDAISSSLAGFLRTPTAAFQVHVGMPDAASLVSAFRDLRNRLALLRGLAAGSPFWHGRDSGLASARAVIHRSYPRTGVPPAFRSYDEYQAIASEQIAAAEAPDHTYLWWDLRPHPRFGTLEVRVMDAQCSLERAAGLAALIQGLARHAVENPPVEDIPDAVLDENDFRAVRYGLDARIVDVDGRMRPLRSIAMEAIETAWHALGRGALGAPLEDLAGRLFEESECARLRRVHASGGMPALLNDLRRRTLVRGSEGEAPSPEEAG